MFRNPHKLSAELGKVVVFAGSTKFKDVFEKEELALTLDGYIVMSLGIFSHADNIELTEDGEKTCMENQKKKIRMCDILYVLDVNGYIGDNTAQEIKYAIDCGKTIFFYDAECCNVYPWEYDNPNLKKRPWDWFRNTGLLLQINQILHNFGIAITCSYDKEGNLIEVYPARTPFRGFGEKSVDKSYANVAKYMKDNAVDLYDEI